MSQNRFSACRAGSILFGGRDGVGRNLCYLPCVFDVKISVSDSSGLHSKRRTTLLRVNFLAVRLDHQVDAVEPGDDWQHGAQELNNAGTGFDAHASSQGFSRKLSAQITAWPVDRNSKQDV